MSTEYGRYSVGMETNHSDSNTDPATTSGEASLFVSGSGGNARYYQIEGDGTKGMLLVPGDVSGDATMGAGGALTIAANAVEGSMINSNAAGNGLSYSANALHVDLSEVSAAAVDASADSILILDGSDSDNTKKESISDLATAMAGNGLEGNSGVFAWYPDEVNAAAIDVESDSINFLDASDSNNPKKESVSDFVDAIASTGLAGDGQGQLEVRHSNNAYVQHVNAAGNGYVYGLKATAGNNLMMGDGAADFVVSGSNMVHSASNPTLVLSASAKSNADGGRASYLRFHGLKADGTNVTVGQVQAAHSGTGDDSRGKMAFKVNDGSSVSTGLLIDYDLKSTFYGDVVVGGTTPTVTIGDAGAEDTMLVFDGNAQDYRIGLDDGTDILEFGVGSTHGTTTSLKMDASRNVDVAAHDGSSVGLKLGGTLVTSTAAELNYVDVTAGAAAASKAVVLDASKNIATIGTVGCGAITSTGNSSFAQVTTSGRVIVDDTTEATSTTDGSLQTDGGLSVAKDIIAGDDVKLLSDSAVLSLGAGSDATLTHDGTTGVTLAANPITLDSAADIVFDADGGDLIFKDDGTEVGRFTNSSSDFVVHSAISDKDLIFKGNDGGSTITALTLDMSEAGAATFNGAITCATSLTIGSAAMSEADLEQLDGITAGTAAASKALVLDASKNIGTINRLTASYAYIGELDVDKINTVTKTETNLEIVDKLIICASGSNSANSDGAGLQFGGAVTGDAVASIKYDHANTAIDFSIGTTTEMRLQNGVLRPETDNDVDLGASGAEFKDLYIDGVAYIDSLQADQLGAALDANSQAITNINVDSGAIDNVIIGANSAAAGTFAALAASTGTFSGVLKTDDATEATTTTDGSLQTDGGLSVAKSAVIGDDLDLLSDGAILNFGADKDVNLTHVADDGLLLNSSKELQFGDADTFICQSSDGILKMAADSSMLLETPDVLISSATDDKPQLELRATNAGANPATILFNHDSASPADDDELGEIVFNGDDDGGTSTMFAKIVGVSTDVSNGSEDGMLEFKFRGAGAVKEWSLGDGAGLVGPNDSTYGTVKAHSFVTYSDETLKTNFTALSNPLETVKKLQGLNYTWKSDGTKDIGFIAQEVEKVVPEVVYSDGKKDGSYGLDYSSLTALLTEAIKQQDNQITELKATLAKVLAKLDK